jgi:hypothetical protein
LVNSFQNCKEVSDDMFVSTKFLVRVVDENKVNPAVEKNIALVIGAFSNQKYKN